MIMNFNQAKLNLEGSHWQIQCPRGLARKRLINPAWHPAVAPPSAAGLPNARAGAWRHHRSRGHQWSTGGEGILFIQAWCAKNSLQMGGCYPKKLPNVLGGTFPPIKFLVAFWYPLMVSHCQFFAAEINITKPWWNNQWGHKVSDVCYLSAMEKCSEDLIYNTRLDISFCASSVNHPLDFWAVSCQV